MLAGMASVNPCRASAVVKHSVARGARCAVSTRFGSASPTASARWKRPRPRASISPASRRAYSRRSDRPAVRASAYENAAGRPARILSWARFSADGMQVIVYTSSMYVCVFLRIECGYMARPA